MKKGTLFVASSGISLSHLTTECCAAIKSADRLFFLISDFLTIKWLISLNPGAESLFDCYSSTKPRMSSYLEMVERILQPVRNGLHVCALFYGHAGLFAFPGHEAIRRAREEGHTARMFPGISSVDCLFADLGVDPGLYGCQIFEATDFLVNNRSLDPRSHLILLQVGVIGEQGFKSLRLDGIPVLVERLQTCYEPEHKVFVYQASPFVICEPRITACPLKDLSDAGIEGLSTLYVPPKGQAAPDTQIMRRLGMSVDGGEAPRAMK